MSIGDRLEGRSDLMEEVEAFSTSLIAFHSESTFSSSMIARVYHSVFRGTSLYSAHEVMAVAAAVTTRAHAVSRW